MAFAGRCSRCKKRLTTKNAMVCATGQSPHQRVLPGIYCASCAKIVTRGVHGAGDSQ